MLYFDENIIRIFGKAMNFAGYSLDAFVIDYFQNITEIMLNSALVSIKELADPEDVEKIEEIAKEIEQENGEELYDLGEFIGKKLIDYPQISQRVEKSISDINEVILSNFLAMAPEKYLTELAVYLGKEMKKNDKLKEILERMKESEKAVVGQ